MNIKLLYRKLMLSFSSRTDSLDSFSKDNDIEEGKKTTPQTVGVFEIVSLNYLWEFYDCVFVRSLLVGNKNIYAM